MSSKKAELRKKMRALRERDAYDGAIADAVCELSEFKRAGLILTYASFGSEVPTDDIMRRAWLAGKRVALPRCGSEPHAMTWHVVESLEGLVRSSFGMREPPFDRSTQVSLQDASREKTLALVPGICFDERGYRLGYGGGYYDAFLGGFGGTSVGLCREAELLASLAELGVLEAHDIPVDMVVTQRRCFYCSRPRACADCERWLTE